MHVNCTASFHLPSRMICAGWTSHHAAVSARFYSFSTLSCTAPAVCTCCLSCDSLSSLAALLNMSGQSVMTPPPLDYATDCKWPVNSTMLAQLAAAATRHVFFSVCTCAACSCSEPLQKSVVGALCKLCSSSGGLCSKGACCV